MAVDTECFNLIHQTAWMLAKLTCVKVYNESSTSTVLLLKQEQT